MKKLTLQNVAERAGVSIGTASRALNDEPRVSTLARNKVIRAARELGYLLPTREEKVIGILLPSLEIPRMEHYFVFVFNALRLELNRRGYQALYVPREDYQLFQEQQVAGVISLDWLGEIAREFPPAKNIPLVCYGDPPNHWENVYAIRSDVAEVIHRTVDYLAGLGHTRIGCVKYFGRQPAANQELVKQSFLAAMTKHGLAKSAFFQRKDAEIQAHEAVTLLLRQGVTALIAYEEAIGVDRFLKLLGKRIPEDISLVAGDTLDAAKLCPSHTTIGQDYLGMVRAALDMLEAHWRGETVSRDRLVRSNLTLRESTGPCPK